MFHAGAKYGSSEMWIQRPPLKMAVSQPAQAGVGFEQLNAAIQVLAEREIKGGEARNGAAQRHP